MDNNFGGVIWTNHALDRLLERGIKQTVALATLTHPQYSRLGTTKGSLVFYRDYGGENIEVVAIQNEDKKWVVLSVWSRPVFRYGKKWYMETGIIEKVVDKILQLLFGKLQSKFKHKH